MKTTLRGLCVAILTIPAIAQEHGTLTLSYRIQETVHPAEGEPTRTKDAVSVRLHTESFDVLRGRVLVQHDVKAGRVAVIDLDKRHWFPQNLLAALDYRYAELANRRKLTQVLEAANIEDAPIGDLLELETLFGVGREAADAIEKSMDDATFTARSGDGEMTHVEFSSRKIPAPLRRSFSQYLFFSCSLHATARDAIAANGRIPKLLRYTSKNSGVTTRVEMTLQEDPAPVPSPDMSKLRCVHSDHERLGKILSAARALHEQKQIAPKQQLLRQIVRARGAKGHTLDAFLLFLELSWMHGKEDPALIRQVLSTDSARLAVQPLTRHLDGKPHQLLEYLDTIPRDSLTHPYLLDVLRANAHQGLQQPKKSIELLLDALEKNPAMAGALKDLGDTWRVLFDMPAAWSCWDVGRQIDPEHPMFAQVDRFEADLRKRFDDMFR